MLRELRIENLLLLERAELRLGEGPTYGVAFEGNVPYAAIGDDRYRGRDRGYRDGYYRDRPAKHPRAGEARDEHDGEERPADRGLSGVFGHQLFVWAFMIHTKDFGHSADVLASLNQLQASRIIAGQSCRQLAAVLHIQQHARNQPRRAIAHGLRILSRGVDKRLIFPAKFGDQWAQITGIQVVHGGHAAFVLQFVHSPTSSIFQKKARDTGEPKRNHVGPKEPRLTA